MEAIRKAVTLKENVLKAVLADRDHQKELIISRELPPQVRKLRQEFFRATYGYLFATGKIHPNASEFLKPVLKTSLIFWGISGIELAGRHEYHELFGSSC